MRQRSEGYIELYVEKYKRKQESKFFGRKSPALSVNGALHETKGMQQIEV